MTVAIEPVGSDAVERVAQLERACFTDPWSPAAILEAASSPRVFFRCARQGGDGQVVGYVVAWFVADEGEIANLAVDPAARGRGIGGALLDAALAEALDRGAASVYLEVRESNAAARRLYESRGFHQVARRRGYYRSPVEDAIVLRWAATADG